MVNLHACAHAATSRSRKSTHAVHTGDRCSQLLQGEGRALYARGVRSGYAAGLVASLRAVGYAMILVAGGLPEIDVPQLRHNLRTCRDEV